MKAAVVHFPGINRERDMAVALSHAAGRPVKSVWHTETSLPADLDLVVLPGGFSFGDYLRAGAIAARSPIMRAVRDKAEQGVLVLGVCNGFQTLCEAGLLPGALLRNASLRFVSRLVRLRVENAATMFSSGYEQGQEITWPVAHHDGNYFAHNAVLDRLEQENRVVFRYLPDDNPNGSRRDIAGIVNARGNVLGMMPHPENLIEAAHGGTDGLGLFRSLADSFKAAA